MKEIGWTIVLIVALLIVFVGCSEDSSDPQITDPSTEDQILTVKEPDTITIKTEGSFEADECKARNLDEKFLMIESKYCSHCQKTLPDFQAACDELGIEPIIIDVATDRSELDQYNVQVQYTPTFIFNCDYFVGSMDKQEYIDMMTVRNDG